MNQDIKVYLDRLFMNLEPFRIFVSDCVRLNEELNAGYLPTFYMFIMERITT